MTKTVTRLLHAIATLCVLLAAATMLVAPTALGARGGETLTKAEVIKRGSEICRAGERAVNALPQLHSGNPFAKNAPKGERERALVFLAGYADALATVRRGLARLDPPAQGRALFKGFVADLGPIVATFRQAHAEGVAGRYQSAITHAEKAFAMFAKASKKTRAYGFPRGVCQSG